MWERDVGIVPVMANHRVAGVVTDRDLAIASYQQGRALIDISVASVMSDEVFCCEPTDPIGMAEQMMADHQVRRLPVVFEGRLVGMISLNDIARGSARSPSEVTPVELGWTLGAICQPRGYDADA